MTALDGGPRIATTTSDAGAAVGSADVTNVPWAMGGTKAMKGGYPDPFSAAGAGTMCELYPSMTLGPCYAQGPVSREDISDGTPGLPVRLSFLVVRATGGCAVVPNAEVDIWHTSAAGVYSTFASGICNPTRAAQPAGPTAKYCRGTRVTDASGRADFNTVFPGHYPGRSIHIHFTVRINGRAYQTSQLFFDDKLSDEIMLTRDYTGRGRRNTTNATDNILRGVDLKKVVASYANVPTARCTPGRCSRSARELARSSRTRESPRLRTRERGLPRFSGSRSGQAGDDHAEDRGPEAVGRVAVRLGEVVVARHS